jgi:hypothetical protein
MDNFIKREKKPPFLSLLLNFHTKLAAGRKDNCVKLQVGTFTSALLSHDQQSTPVTEETAP